MVQLGTRKREMRDDGGNRPEKLGLREFHVRLISPCAIRQSQVPIWGVITLISGLPNLMMHLVPMMSRIRSYRPYCFHLHPPSLFLVHHSTIIAEHKVKSSLSISPRYDHELTLCTAYTEYSIHQVQYTLCTAYTEYSIHRVQHTPSTAYTEYSIHRVQHTPSSTYTEYSIHQVQHTPSTVYTRNGIHWMQHPPNNVSLPIIYAITSWPLNVASASSVSPYKINR